ncbi:MAG: phosphoribosylformylglycinamidine cyclo-ligase [Bacilli bacterium]|jgi:phosphoribosylformylglycinamidine cyclo-ligase
MSKIYKSAGVDLEAGYEGVRLIKEHVLKTKRLGMMGGIGSFGGMFDLSILKYKEPVLVSGTDGVGTKLMIAQLLDIHDTIGQDVVAMCVNDVLAQGAEPIFFLDYIAIGKNDPLKVSEIVKGVSDGCIKAGAALVGGETAEMPDMYQKDEYDIAGFTVGVVEKSKIIDGSKVSAGDVLIGIKSSGIHSNGYSLVRKIVFKDQKLNLEEQVGPKKLKEWLIEPTRIYVKSVLEVIKNVDVHAIAHITGGGFDENIPRALNKNQGATIFEEKLPKLEIFKYLEEKGGVNHREMYNVFNMGVGMIIIVKKNDAKKVIEILNKNGEEAFEIGVVTTKEGIEIL